MKIHQLIPRARLLRWFFTIVLLGMIGQNCQDPRLVRSVQTLTTQSELYVKLSDPVYQLRRYVFLVDMSQSMVRGPCARDIDGNSPPPLSALAIECVIDQAVSLGAETVEKTYAGVDPSMTRLEAIVYWLKQAQSALTPGDQNNVKVLIVPFSGGVKDTDRIARETSLFGGTAAGLKWRSLNEALLYVQGASPIDPTQAQDPAKVIGLENEQRRDTSIASDPYNWPDYMGTSVPAPRISNAYDIIREDLKSLDVSGQLSNTLYHFMYLSDGVPAPTPDQVLTAKNMSPCVGGTASVSCDDVVAALKENWGDGDLNKMESVRTQFDRIKQLTERAFPAVDFYFSLVLVNPDRIPASQRTNDNNFLFYLRNTSNRYQLTNLQSATPPFAIRGLPRPFATYRVTAFMAFNANARLAPNGNVEVDSDGDGLFDYEEAALGTDPKNPRTDGVCLDIIATNPAYKDVCKAYSTAFKNKVLDTCDPLEDADQDGLNECEELILGTDPYDFDTDDDSIPDGLEVIFRTFPLKDDSVIDTNSDGISNLVNFQHGLLPQALIKQVDTKFQIQLTKRYLGNETLPLADGRSVDSEVFKIDLTGSPLMRTLGNVIQPLLYNDESHDPSALIPHDRLLLTGPTQQGTNDIIFLARVEDVDDPSRSHWLMAKRTVAIGTSVNLEIDLSEMKMLKNLDRLK